MPSQPDAVTRWWRRISLRAKVTGVTVAVLTLGLVITGIGTIPILRGSLVENVKTQVLSIAASDRAERFFSFTSDDHGSLVATPVEGSPRLADDFIAIYDAQGVLTVTAGGQPGAEQPIFPETYSQAQAYADSEQLHVIKLPGTEGTEFLGAVSIRPVAGSNITYTQLVVMSLAETDHIINLYFGVFTTIALITILVAALLTRGLVTLTFRRLGQVETTAMAIAAGDFSQRMTDLESTTEVGRLNLAINTMLDRVDRALAQRESTVKHMRRFIGDASHELRTPLVSVRGYAELYRMGAIRGEEDTARAMERIEKEAMRMGVLVEDLLALARLDEKRELTIEPLDLRPLARDAALDVRAAAPQRIVTVVDTTADAAQSPEPVVDPTATSSQRALPAKQRGAAAFGRRLLFRGRETAPVTPIDFSEAVVTPVSTPPIVLGEENKVRQVIANLLGNARRFSPDDSPIEIIIGADRHRGVGWFSIVDHGEGIPEQIREQIFQRFWRADNSRTRETGGSGLGLAIVASILHALNGTVQVDETPGGGATFTVSLPLAPARVIPEHLLQDTQPLNRLDS